MSTVAQRRGRNCKNCGNGAEMEITCSLPENTFKASADTPSASSASSPSLKSKSQATCTYGGHEADMWVD